MTWQYHNNSQPAKARRDFTKMNIDSLKNGVVNSKVLFLLVLKKKFICKELI